MSWSECNRVGCWHDRATEGRCHSPKPPATAAPVIFGTPRPRRHAVPRPLVGTRGRTKAAAASFKSALLSSSLLFPQLVLLQWMNRSFPFIPSLPLRCPPYPLHQAPLPNICLSLSRLLPGQPLSRPLMPPFYLSTSPGAYPLFPSLMFAPLLLFSCPSCTAEQQHSVRPHSLLDNGCFHAECLFVMSRTALIGMHYRKATVMAAG